MAVEAAVASTPCRSGPELLTRFLGDKILSPLMRSRWREAQDQRMWCAVVGATNNNDEENGNGRILDLDGCDDHDADRVAGVVIV